MTASAWLALREPRPPHALASRMTTLLRECGLSEGGPDVSETLLCAAEAVLVRLLREGCATRESALDLLVVDAFVTYAFEAAAAQPERIVERTRAAMARISALADVAQGTVAVPTVRSGG